MQYLIQPYHQLLTKLANHGFDTDSTKALYNEKIVFDLMPLNVLTHDNKMIYQLFLPHKRGLKNTSVKYGIAEGIWYRQATQKIDAIAKYGKIWHDMVDDEGNVNSNYGYQIKNNNDVLEQIKNLVSEFELNGQSVEEFYIASAENQFSRSDCTCNNKVAISLTRNQGQVILDCNVYARSIDVMFGLPYDTFTFNGFMAMVAEEITKITQENVYLSSLSFDIVNVHWYKRDDITQQAIDNLSEDVLLIPHDVTPYSDFRKDFSDYGEQDIVEAREYANSYVQIKPIQSQYRDLSYLNHIMPKVRVSNKAKNERELERMLKFMLDDADDATTQLRIKSVIDYLKDNCHDRKTIVMTPSKNLAYVSYINDNYYITLYESIESEKARNQTTHFYTDGSFTIKKPDVYGWSVYIELPNGSTDMTYGVGDRFLKSRQVGGELESVLKVIDYCIRYRIYQFDIIHDYQGAKDIITGDHTARSDVSKYYRDKFNNLYSKLEEMAINETGSKPKMRFKHIKGHNNLKGNEIADSLAIKAIYENNKKLFTHSPEII